MLVFVFLHTDGHWHIGWRSGVGAGFGKSQYPTLAAAVEEAKARNPSATIYEQLKDGQVRSIEGY